MLLPQDSEFQLKRGRVTITQSVPNGKWFLVPTPAIKVRFLYSHSLSVVPGADPRHRVRAASETCTLPAVNGAVASNVVISEGRAEQGISIFERVADQNEG